MSARRDSLARKACAKCSTQKRRCDRTLPECGLCVRLHQSCKYEPRALPSSGPTPSPSPRSETLLIPFTPNHTREAIIQSLKSFTPQDAISTQSTLIDPWFPIISIPRLQSRLPTSWQDCPLDLLLLCFAVKLVASIPQKSQEDAGNPSEFKSLYYSAKSWISLIEGFAINSLDVVQARILLTLFEVVHGLYPGAYLSIAGTVRAADSLAVYPDGDVPPNLDDDETRLEGISAWCGILVLDRYITVESGLQPSLTRSRIHPLYAKLEPIMCPAPGMERDHNRPICRLGRLLESSALVDEIHTILYDPTKEIPSPDFGDVMMAVDSLHSSSAQLSGEIEESRRLYSGGLTLCNIGLLLAFENGSKVYPVDGATTTCTYIATTSLNTLSSTITDMVEPFALSLQPIEFNALPPFVTFLVYKTAMLITGRMSMEGVSADGMRKLMILRSFLKMVGKRWLCCERYLKLLNDDTTPRILRALE